MMADEPETPEEYVRRMLAEAGADAPVRSSWDLKKRRLEHQLATKYWQSQIETQTHYKAIREKTLGDFSDAELVMEMIKRGYATMKLPKDGGPPEVLR